jgi:hypothetical protein
MGLTCALFPASVENISETDTKFQQSSNDRTIGLLTDHQVRFYKWGQSPVQCLYVGHEMKREQTTHLSMREKPPPVKDDMT